MYVGNVKGGASWPAEFSIAANVFEDVVSVGVAGNRSFLAEAAELVWEGTGPYQYLSAAQQLKVVSDSALDAYGSSGTWVVYIEGLDGNYIDVQEAVVLSGATPATTVNSFLRIFKFTAVAGGSNAGHIKVKSNDLSIDLMHMLPGYGQSTACIFTAPANTTLFISQMFAACPHNCEKVVVSMWVRPFGMPWQCKGRIGFEGNPITREIRIPHKIPAKADVEYRGERVGGTRAECSVGFAGWLEYSQLGA